MQDYGGQMTMPMSMSHGAMMSPPVPEYPMPMSMPMSPPPMKSGGGKYDSNDKCMMVMNVCDMDDRNGAMRVMMKKMKESMKEVMNEMMKKQKKSYGMGSSPGGGSSRSYGSKQRDMKDLMKETMLEVMKEGMHQAMLKNLYPMSDWQEEGS